MLTLLDNSDPALKRGLRLERTLTIKSLFLQFSIDIKIVIPTTSASGSVTQLICDRCHTTEIVTVFILCP